MRERAWIIVVAASSCAAAAMAQVPPPNAQPAAGPAFAQPYMPAVPPPSMYGGYGGWGYQGGASTAAGSAMNGMANVISAKGDYNLTTSEAAINMTQAQSQEIKNRQQYTNTYFAMRQTNAAARAQEAGPSPTEEQLVRIAHEGVPKPLSPSEQNPVSGSLAWPSYLQSDQFAAARSTVDALFAKHASLGTLSYSDQVTARHTLDGMYTEMKSHIRDIAPPDYIACRTFLNSIMYATTKNELQ